MPSSILASPVAPAGTQPVITGPVLTRLARSVLFLVRSPKDALLVGLLWLMFLASAGSAWRRRRLVELLENQD